MNPIRKYEVRIFQEPSGRQPFDEWFRKLPQKIQSRVDARIERIGNGNLGDCKAVGGVFELRLHFGPGYRVYFGIVEDKIVLLLNGGDKGTQAKDIKKAKQYLDQFRSGL